jgi:hypothetical protein
VLEPDLHPAVLAVCHIAGLGKIKEVPRIKIGLMPAQGLGVPGHNLLQFHAVVMFVHEVLAVCVKELADHDPGDTSPVAPVAGCFHVGPVKHGRCRPLASDVGDQCLGGGWVDVVLVGHGGPSMGGKFPRNHRMASAAGPARICPMTEPVLTAADELSVHDLFRAHGEVLTELTRRKVIRSRSLVGDVGEYLAAAMYEAVLAPPVTAAFDLTDAAGRRIQVKTRAFNSGPGNRRFNGLDEGGFDAVLFLALDPASFQPFLAREVTADRVEELVASYRGIRYPHIAGEGLDLLDKALTVYRNI